MPVRRVRRRRRALLARLADEIGLDAGARDDLLAALLVRVAEEASVAATERDERSPSGATVPRGGLADRFAGAVVRGRWAIVVAWITVAVVVTLGLPSIREAQVGALGDLVPAGAQAITTEERSAQLFAFPLLSRTIVVVRDAGGLSVLQQGSVGRSVVLLDRGRAAAAARDARVRGLQRDRRDAVRARAFDDDRDPAAVPDERRAEREDRRRPPARREARRAGGARSVRRRHGRDRGARSAGGRDRGAPAARGARDAAARARRGRRVLPRAAGAADQPRRRSRWRISSRSGSSRRSASSSASRFPARCSRSSSRCCSASSPTIRCSSCRASVAGWMRVTRPVPRRTARPRS